MKGLLWAGLREAHWLSHRGESFLCSLSWGCMKNAWQKLAFECLQQWHLHAIKPFKSLKVFSSPPLAACRKQCKWGSFKVRWVEFSLTPTWSTRCPGAEKNSRRRSLVTTFKEEQCLSERRHGQGHLDEGWCSRTARRVAIYGLELTVLPSMCILWGLTKESIPNAQSWLVHSRCSMHDFTHDT